MKKSITYLLSLLIISLFSGCNKDGSPTIPVIYTIPVSNITATTATSGGNITFDGWETITARGVCWSTAPNPTTSDSKTTSHASSAQFGSVITGLTEGKTYHVRAYATNSVGTDYGIDISFSTLGQVPSVITKPAFNISATEATLSGTVNPNDLSTIVTFEYGTTSDYGSIIAATNTLVKGNAIINVYAEITGLTSSETYHFRVKTLSSIGTSYGDDMSFTAADIPTISTTATSSIIYSYGFFNTTCGGNIISDGGASITASGVCWNYTGNPTISDSHTIDGSGAGTFTSSLYGLLSATTYYVRAYATNNSGISYGNQLSFTTPITPPEDGLVAYYIFNGNANDITGNGKNGTINGATLTSNRFGMPNSAYSFNGNSDIVLPISSVEFLNDYAISFWVSLSDIRDENSGILHSNSLRLEVQKALMRFTYYSNPATTLTSSNYALVIGPWYHLVINRKANETQMYINGSLISSATGIYPSITDNTLIFGNNVSGFRFYGILDEIRIYHRSLSGEEIQQLSDENGYFDMK